MPDPAPKDPHRSTSFKEEVTFGQLLIQKGYATVEQVRECLAIQQRAPADSQGRPLRLGDIMMRKGYISMEAIEDVLRSRTTQVGSSSTHGIAPISFTEIPPEVKELADDPKRRLGKYILWKEIGRGGMGQVYKAWDAGLNRVVAVKILTSDTSREYVTRFMREAQTAASLSHPNLMPIYDMGEQEGKYYIAMQYIDGRTLAEQRLSLTRAVELVRTAALALEAAHRAGIIHRDVKPANLMIDRTGRLYVMDFGLAKAIRARSDVTREGMAMGTPSYMSPEQAHGQTLGPRSDVYSLGATLYHLVTGRPPFDGATPIATIMNVLNTDAPAPRSVNRSVPSDLELIIQRCLEKETRHRYPSAQALADDLERFLKGEPISARPPSFTVILGRKLRRNRGLLPGAAAMAIAAAALVAWLAWSSSQLDQVRDLTDKANGKYAAGKYADALDLYNQALALDRSNRRVQDRIDDCRKRLREAEARAAEQARREREEVDRRQREEKERERLRAVAGPELEKGKEKLEQAEKDLYRKGADLVASRAKAGDAIVHFDRALKACPEHAEALTYRGRARLMRLEFDAAEADFSKAIAVATGYGPARIARGRLHIRRYIDIAVDAGGMHYLKGRLAEAARQARERAADDFAAAAKAGLGEKQHAFDAMLRFAETRLQECLDSCDRALAENATDEEMHKLRGDALFFGAGVDGYRRVPQEGVRPLETAAESYARAIELRTNYPEARAMRAVVLLALGRPEAAREDLEAALAVDRGHFLALIMYAKLLSDAGEPERALEHYAKAQQAKTDSYFARVNRAAVLAALERNDESLRDLDEAITLNPDHVWAWQLKGALLKRAGRAEEAESILTKAIEMAPDFATIWYNRGATRHALGRIQEAIEDFEEAVRRNHPNSAQIRELIRKLKRE